MMWCAITPHRYPSLFPEAEAFHSLGSTKQRATPDFGDGIFAITIIYVHVKTVESQFRYVVFRNPGVLILFHDADSFNL